MPRAGAGASTHEWRANRGTAGHAAGDVVLPRWCNDRYTVVARRFFGRRGRVKAAVSRGVFGISVIGQLFIDAALLGLLIFIFARYNATNDMFNRIVVVAGVTVGTMVMAGLWADTLGLWLLVPQMLLTGGLLIWLVGTNPVQAAIITVLFLGIKIALRVAMAYVMSGA